MSVYFNEWMVYLNHQAADECYQQQIKNQAIDGGPLLAELK